MERTLKHSEQGYKNLVAVASILDALSPNGYHYEVEDTYLDFGQNWMWTTITRDSSWGGCQVLCPRDWKLVVLATNADELLDAVKSIISDEYFGDK